MLRHGSPAEASTQGTDGGLAVTPDFTSVTANSTFRVPDG